jgi:hypothetical protein
MLNTQPIKAQPNGAGLRAILSSFFFSWDFRDAISFLRESMIFSFWLSVGVWLLGVVMMGFLLLA